MNVVYVLNNWKSRFRGTIVMPGARGGNSHPCAIGRGGMTACKKEGDGSTPIGRYRALEVYYRPDRVTRPITRLPIRQISKKMGWCDATFDRNYNREVELPYSASHEKMTRDDHLYDLVVVLDYNIKQRTQGTGSAIFFHLAHPDFRATEGCVAVQERVMRMFLKQATTNTVLDIQP